MAAPLLRAAVLDTGIACDGCARAQKGGADQAAAGGGAFWLDVATLAMQLAALVTYASLLVSAYSAPTFMRARYAIYNDPATAPARLLLPAKIGTFSVSDSNSTGGAAIDLDTLPLCGTGSSGVMPYAMPTWVLPSDESDLHMLVRAQVRGGRGALRRSHTLPERACACQRTARALAARSFAAVPPVARRPREAAV